MVGRPSGVRDERWGGETRQFRKGGSRRRYTREGTYLAPSIGRAEPYFGYATKRSRLAMRSLVRCTSVGTFKTCRPVLTMSVCWVNQKVSLRCRPPCVVREAGRGFDLKSSFKVT